MWIHRALRTTPVWLLAAALAGCAPTPAQAPLAAAPSVQVPPPGAAVLTSSDPAAQPTSDALPVGSDDPVWGSAMAPVTLVEFSDLQCPFCSRVHPTIKSLQAKYGPNQLRVVFKHNPLPFHEHARPAAKVADAVYRQGGSPAFYAFLDLAFSHQMELGDRALGDWVGRVGLDAGPVLKRAELPETADKIERDMALASHVGANGTPAFRINGITLVGAQPLEAFTSIIDAELSATAELRTKGMPPAALYPARVATNFSAPKPEAPDEPEEDLGIWKVPIKGAPSVGPADALVTIVEFFDYQCPYCRRVEPTLNELTKRYPKDVRLVLRQNPLPFHPRALPAANLALEARAEKGDVGFLEANRLLFEPKLDSLEESALIELGKQLKLNDQRVLAALTQNPHAAEIDADIDLASDLKAGGTPYFFVNGQRLSGAQPLESFVALVDAQLKVANALVAAGIPRAGVYDEIMKRAKEPEGPEQKSLPAPTSENPARGPQNAPIVIHEFSDFQCPFCSRVEATIAELDKAYPNKIRFVWHDYPLPFHEHARPAALLAREVRAQKGEAAFWKIHDALFRDQGVDGSLAQAGLEKFAQDFKLDMGRFASAQTDGRHDAVLAHDKALADAAGIHGTPAFVINGYYLSGAQPLSAFKRVVRYALAHPAAAMPAVLAAPNKP